jgi:tetratricopeptide (TPR) repeat protein
MKEASSTEAPFEIVMLSEDHETGVAGFRTATAGPIGGSVRPERWLFVTHVLVLLSLVGLGICVVGLVRLSRSADVGEATPTTAAPILLPQAIASVAVEPVVDAPPEVPIPTEPVQLALAPRSGAEGPIPAGSKPEAAPPAPAVEVPEPVPVPAAAVEPPPLPAEARVVVRPEESEARKLLDEARLLEADNPALGLARYRKALELLPEKTDLWKSVADLELSRGAVEPAARAYREFLKTHPDRADALQNLGILEMRSGRTDDARTCLESAIRAAPSADLYYNLGNLYFKAQGYEPAVSAYRRALEYEPRHAEARFNLALALERTGKRGEAVAALAQLGSVSPDVVRERARMEAMMGGIEADRAFGLARGSGDVDTVLGVAAGFRQAGESEKALALLDRAVELAPKQASARLNRGVLRQAMGRLSEAAADYEEAANLDPSLSEARFNMGVLAEERGQYVAALGHYAAALKVNAGMACALNNVGALYLKVGQPEKAVEWFHRCRAADSEFSSARVNLAWAYLALGSKELALTELKAYAQEVPKEKRSADAVRVLGELEAAPSRK